MMTYSLLGNEDRYYTPEPEWFKSERMDYCETVKTVKKAIKKTPIASYFKQLLHK